MGTEQLAFYSLCVLTLGFFVFTSFRILSNFKLTRSESRLDHVGARLWKVLEVAIGQTKILKKPVAGLLHALVFWGFIIITVGTAEMIIDGLLGTERILGGIPILYDIITASGEIMAAVIIISGLIFLARRYITKPKRFIAPEMKPSSRLDATLIIIMIFMLMLSLIGMNTGYVMITEAPVGTYPVSDWLINSGIAEQLSSDMHVFETVNWWIHIGLVLIFLNILPYSKHFHVLLSLPNVFLTRLKPKAYLNAMESVTREVKSMMDPNTAFAAAPEGEQAMPERFGVKDAEDVSWKTLMDAYTCTECGRCTDACPANTTGKKLSPRKLFIDLRARMSEKASGLKKSGGQYSDGKSLVGDYITEEELWACTSCMACMEECPVNIEHVPFIADMRRNLVMEESKMPSELAMMCTNIENNGAPWQFSPSERFNWAQEIYVNE